MNYLWKLYNNNTGEIVEHSFIFFNYDSAKKSAERYAKYRNWKSFKIEIITVSIVNIKRNISDNK
jgi:hypothetical protein